MLDYFLRGAEKFFDFIGEYSVRAAGAVFPGAFQDEARKLDVFTSLNRKLDEGRKELDGVKKDLEKITGERDWERKAREEAQRQLELSQNALDSAQEQLGNLRLNYQELQGSHSALKGGLARARRQVLSAINLVRNVRTGKDVILARAQSHESETRNYANWQMFGEARLTRELEQARATALEARANSVYIGISAAMRVMPKVPFVYYDLSRKQLACTPSALKFCGVEETSEKMSLLQLLRHIKRDDLEAECGILSAIKYGRRLSHHEARTSDGRKLMLTTYPLADDNKVYGMGIFLYDPRFSLKRIGVHKLIGIIDRVFSDIRERYSQLKVKPAAI